MKDTAILLPSLHAGEVMTHGMTAFKRSTAVAADAMGPSLSPPLPQYRTLHSSAHYAFYLVCSCLIEHAWGRVRRLFVDCLITFYGKQREEGDAIVSVHRSPGSQGFPEISDKTVTHILSFCLPQMVAFASRPLYKRRGGKALRGALQILDVFGRLIVRFVCATCVVHACFVRCTYGS